MLWTEKYAPKKLCEVAGQGKTVRRISEWAAAWQKKRGRPLLLWGGVGCGKTAVAYVAAMEYGFELFEMNASDTRNAQAVRHLVGNAAVSRTIFGKRRLLLVDEAEGFYGSEDRGGVAAIAEALKTAVCPIILTANDAWDPKLSPLRGVCEFVKLGRPAAQDVVGVLRRIAGAEKVCVEEEALERIAEKNRGDVRAAINDLQSLAAAGGKVGVEDVSVLGNRDREEEILQAVRVVLKTFDFHESRRAFNALDEEPDFVLKWVEENMPREYTDAEDLSKGFERLSKADVFLGRTRRRQVFVFWKYAADLMSAGVSLSKTRKYSSFTHYGFPSSISLLSRTRPEREMRKRIGHKIAGRCHVSTRRGFADYFSLFTETVRSGHAAELAAEFSFDAEELEFLGVQDTEKVLEKAAELRAKKPAEGDLSKWF